ncbi:MAG: hypothetical protein AAF585_07145 [Verrucomicrobiota bacterium]
MFPWLSFEDITGFLDAHCSKCYNSEKKKGGINFEEFADFKPENAVHWQDVLDSLQKGDMLPEDGGALTKHEFGVFFDEGFKSPMHTIETFTVRAEPGVQEFEVFGNVYEFPGVDPARPPADNPFCIMAHFHCRFLLMVDEVAKLNALIAEQLQNSKSNQMRSAT